MNTAARARNPRPSTRSVPLSPFFNPFQPLCLGSTISDCTFIESSGATYGGGVRSDASSPIIRDCVFAANGVYAGGGVYAGNGGSPTVTDCIFSDNVSGNGGGIYVTAAAITVNGCSFAGNYTSPWNYQAGGGLNFYNALPSEVRNCVIAGNYTPGGNDNGAGGGGICIRNSSPAIINCTIYFNRATDGGGLFNFGGSLAGVTNCILWDNYASSQGPEIYSHSSTSTVSFCDIEGGISGAGIYNTSGGQLTDGGGNTNANPLFAGTNGSWTTGSSYDALTGKSTLADTTASWTPGAFVGALLNPDTTHTWYRQFVIATNTATSITVWGDAAVAVATDPYQVYDYHLQSDGGRWTPFGFVNDTNRSPCIDGGDDSMDVGDEIPPNGDTINMGAYGGTLYASKSSPPPAGTVVLIR
ncbi:MAG: hypothetical protein HQ559_00215 [Lentisphaerae bacterium]|nr:hypothetical protein [Lentisphaerota bacterium]